MFILLFLSYNKLQKGKGEFMEHFEKYFNKVKPIIFKLRRYYFIKLWDYDDWLQEGRLVLYRLLEEHPNLKDEDLKLYIYFKTKFSNHLKDEIRHQESIKRKFNRMPYEEISELGHCISAPFMEQADYLGYQEAMNRVIENLGPEAKEKLGKVMRGERFEGKKSFLGDIKPYFSDFW